MSNIKEILVEPSKITVGSTFSLKIKANRSESYGDLKKSTVGTVKLLTVGQLKED